MTDIIVSLIIYIVVGIYTTTFILLPYYLRHTRNSLDIPIPKEIVIVSLIFWTIILTIIIFKFLFIVAPKVIWNTFIKGTREIKKVL